MPETTLRSEFDGVVRQSHQLMVMGQGAAARELIEQFLRDHTVHGLPGRGDWPERGAFATMVMSVVLHHAQQGEPLGANLWGAFWAVLITGYLLGIEEAGEISQDLGSSSLVEEFLKGGGADG